MERKGIFKFSGQEMTVISADLSVGQISPGFTAQVFDRSFFFALDETKNSVTIGSFIS
jgi:hypothetical protein